MPATTALLLGLHSCAASFVVTPAHEECGGLSAMAATGQPSIQNRKADANWTADEVANLIARKFNARITDTLRPWDATHGALNSYHKYGQAVDFVPRAGLASINRSEIRDTMAQHGIQLLELLGPGDPGHSNHWHVAFARAASNDGAPTVPGPLPAPLGAELGVAATESAAMAANDPSPPNWDVFATADWRTRHGETQ